MERRLSGILAGDVVGYSRLMEEDEADTFSRLRLHRKELFEPKIGEHHGRIFKLMGDGLLAEFASVVDAVECAADLQREMAKRNNGLPPERRIDVRIGVHLGDVIVEGEDRHGDAVNIAARLQQLAEPGGIAVSQTVLDHVGNRIALGFESMGSHQVKNISKPVTVYRVKLDGVPNVRRTYPAKWGAKKRAFAMLAAVVLLLGAGAIVLGMRWRQSGSTAASNTSSIAVLPFENIGDDPKWGRFADGITEDIITDLSHSKALSVIARNSTEVFKGKAIDIRQVGRDLGVKYVLEGSIEAMGERIRVTAQLIEATTGTHVWSERFDRPIGDVFLVQNEVTERIAASISGYEGAVAEAERALLHRKAPQILKPSTTICLAWSQSTL
jgi:TolB-like protein/class 3 adenylate cyclase